MIAANGIRKRRLLCDGSDPRSEPLTVDDPKTLTTDRLGAQHRSAQLLVSADRVYGDSGDQPGLIRFFLRASARSKLRRWTLTPNLVAISTRHCEVVNSGLTALSSTAKATTSAEIL